MITDQIKDELSKYYPSQGLSNALGVTTMMMLGNYRFCISNATYQTLRHNSEYRWNSINKINSDPAMQYTGKGTETINLDGIIYPYLSGGINQISLMRTEAESGNALMLISGNGFAFGKWCITSISESQSIFFQDGTPRRIEFTMALKSYPQEKTRGAKGIIEKLNAHL